MKKASRPQNHEKTLDQFARTNRTKEEKQTEGNSRLRGVGSQLRTAAQRGCPNPEDAEDRIDCSSRLQLQRMMFVNPEESWSSKTEASGYDQQIRRGTFTIFKTTREDLCKNYHARSSAKWETMEDNQEAEDQEK